MSALESYCDTVLRLQNVLCYTPDFVAARRGSHLVMHYNIHGVSYLRLRLNSSTGRLEGTFVLFQSVCGNTAATAQARSSTKLTGQGRALLLLELLNLFEAVLSWWMAPLCAVGLSSVRRELFHGSVT